LPVAAIVGVPDEQIDSLSVADRSYIGGLIDGEGCLLIYRKVDRHGVPSFRSMATISNTSVRLIEWLQARVSGVVSKGTDGGSNRLLVYHWRVEGPRVVPLLTAMRPYLVVKAELADRVVAMQRTMLYSFTGRRLPVEVVQERERLFDAYRRERTEMKGR
jgi:hypothetical protein